MLKESVAAWQDRVSQRIGPDADKDYCDDKFFRNETDQWKKYNGKHFPGMLVPFSGAVIACLADAYSSQKNKENLSERMEKQTTDSRSMYTRCPGTGIRAVLIIRPEAL